MPTWLCGGNVQCGLFSVTGVRRSNFAGLYHLAGLFGCRLMPLKITLKNFPPRATTLLRPSPQKKITRNGELQNFARLFHSDVAAVLVAVATVAPVAAAFLSRFVFVALQI